MLKISSSLQQFDLKFVRVTSVLAGQNSVSSMIRVGYDSGRSFLDSIISVNGYVSITKIGYSSGSAFPFSIVNRFGYNFGSSSVDSINQKEEHIFGSIYFRFRFGFSSRVTFEQLQGQWIGRSMQHSYFWPKKLLCKETCYQRCSFG